MRLVNNQNRSFELSETRVKHPQLLGSFNGTRLFQLLVPQLRHHSTNFVPTRTPGHRWSTGSDHRSAGPCNLWDDVQAIAPKDKKQSLSHLLQCPRPFVNDAGVQRQRASGCQGKRSEDDPKDANWMMHKRSNARASLIFYLPSLRSS